MTLVDSGVEFLPDDACKNLLASAAIGRVAITMSALPVILPVNFTVLDDDIVFLTGEGTKLRAALEQAVVAFEVDDFDIPMRTGWSVLAVGVACEITDEDELAQVRKLDLRPFAGGDRTHYVRIRPEFYSGRRII